MGSELAAAEAVRLAAAAAAAFSGVTAATGVWSAARRGDGRGSVRSIAAMLTASGAVATGAWAFVMAARLGAVPDGLAVYLSIGFAAGLLAALFPRAAGIPLLLTAVLASALAAAGLGSWLAWEDGTEAARLTAYQSEGERLLYAIRTDAGRGLTEERNLSLAEGPVTMEFERVTVRGPFSVPFGTRRYRLAAIVAGGERVSMYGDRGPAFDEPDGGSLARLLGCSVEAVAPPAFEPYPLVPVSYVLRPDGSIERAEK